MGIGTNRLRATLVVALLSVIVYANSLGNGFAYDDTGIILANPVVQEGGFEEALSHSYWPQASSGSGLFRPLTTLSFQWEWARWGDNPMPFHALNVLLHALNSVLVLLLAWRLLPAWPALFAGVLFAVHPVHTEAVANIAGRGELLAAFFVLLGVLLYAKAKDGGDAERILALLSIPGLFLLALWSKEIAVALPPLCLLVTWFAVQTNDDEAWAPTLGRIAPVFALLVAVFSLYALQRLAVLGVLTGDAPAAELRELGPGGRLLTALALWPEYLRLMVFPLDLAADYGPAVFLPAVTVDPGVIFGALILAGCLALLVIQARRPTAAWFGCAWFLIAILPVSHLFFPTGTILAERTLYLPSVGFCIAAAFLGHRLAVRTPRRRVLVGVAVGAVALAFAAANS